MCGNRHLVDSLGRMKYVMAEWHRDSWGHLLYSGFFWAGYDDSNQYSLTEKEEGS